MKNLTDQQKGSLMAFVAVMFITPDSLFIRMSNVDTWGLVFYRGIIPFLTVFLVMMFIYKLGFFKILINSGYHGIIYVLTFSLTNITFVMSLENTNVANTLIMLTLAPFIAALLSMFFLNEFPNKRTWIAMILCFSFVVFIFYDSYASGRIYGDILGFITAFLVGASSVVIRFGKSVNFLPSLMLAKFFTMFICLFFLNSISLIGSDIYIIPIMCIFFVTIPLALLTLAPRYIPAHEVELFFVLETTLGPFWVWLVINEQPSIKTIIGGALIITTIAIYTLLELKAKKTLYN